MAQIATMSKNKLSPGEMMFHVNNKVKINLKTPVKMITQTRIGEASLILQSKYIA